MNIDVRMYVNVRHRLVYGTIHALLKQLLQHGKPKPTTGALDKLTGYSSTHWESYLQCTKSKAAEFQVTFANYSA